MEDAPELTTNPLFPDLKSTFPDSNALLPVFTFTDPEVAETAVSNATEPNDEDWSTTLPPIAVELSPADRSKLPAPTRLEPVLTDKEPAD